MGRHTISLVFAYIVSVAIVNPRCMRPSLVSAFVTLEGQRRRLWHCCLRVLTAVPLTKAVEYEIRIKWRIDVLLLSTQ